MLRCQSLVTDSELQECFQPVVALPGDVGHTRIAAFRIASRRVSPLSAHGFWETPDEALPEIDLSRSLRQVFGNKADFADQIEQDRARQSETANAILRRFFGAKERDRRELIILADEVGLGKTYVALAVAISILDAIRRGEAPDGLPSNKPVVLVLTPTNDALFNKWMREAEAFKKDCARNDGGIDWLQIRCPVENSSKSGNMINLSEQMRDATRSQPMLLIAKQGVLGAALHEHDLWRRRGLASLFGYFRTPTETRRYWCRKGRVFDKFGIPELNELLDLRGSGHLWDDSHFA